MKVLITGGAGFLGINLTRYLLGKGWEVVSLDIAPFDYPERDMITVITGDVRDKEVVKDAIDKVEVIVHCAAALPLYEEEEIFSTNVKGTENILEEALKQKKRVIHISSTAVYGIPNHHPILESDPCVGVGAYGKSKIEAEKICERYRSEMCVPILRPKSFIGPERLGIFALLFEWAMDGKNFPLIGAKNKYQLLDVEDLSRAIFICATKEEELVNDTFNVGAKNFKTMKEDFQAVLDFAGHDKKIKVFPARPVIIILKILEKLKVSPIYQWIYETAGKDSYVSVDKIEEKLGFFPYYSNEGALLRSYKWYVENRSEYEGRSGVSHRVPWKMGILKFVKLFF